MKVRYIAIYRIHGASSLPDGAECIPLFSQESPKFTATLTMNPEADFLHVDRSGALAMQLLRGIFAPDKKGQLKECLAAAIEEMRAHRTKFPVEKMSLVFAFENEIPPPEFNNRYDTDEFGICIDTIDTLSVLGSFRRWTQATTVSLGLSMPADVDRRIEKLGEVIYLIDPDNNKPVYTFSLRGLYPSVSIASPLTNGAIANAAALVPELADNKVIDSPARLLLTSFQEATDHLLAFIAAWTALEIFVTAIGATYEANTEERYLSASAIPTAENQKGSYLAEKFSAIASVLDPAALDSDKAEFMQAKKIRDKLFHKLDIPPSPLPTNAAQKLLLKYLKLHLIRRA